MGCMMIAESLTRAQIESIVRDGFIADGRAGHSLPCDMVEEIRSAPEFYLGAEVWSFTVPGSAENGICIRCTPERGSAGGIAWNAGTSWGSWDDGVLTIDDADRLRFCEDGTPHEDEDEDEDDA